MMMSEFVSMLEVVIDSCEKMRVFNESWPGLVQNFCAIDDEEQR